MSTIITTRLERRVEADPSGMTVTDTTDGQSIMVALTRAQAGELAAALVPGRDFSGVDWKTMYDQARSERDAAVARADQLRDERDDAVQSCMAVGRERDEWKARAEAAEARTAPAVTHHEVNHAVRTSTGKFDLSDNLRQVVDAVWPLVSGADPAVFVVRESDLPDVERDEDGHWLCEKVLVVNGKDTAEDLRGRALPQLKHIAMREAVARAIEAEQATDPVERLAGQIESATREAIRQVCDDLADVVPSLDPLTVEQAMEVTAASRKVARHVLGQEADQ